MVIVNLASIEYLTILQKFSDIKGEGKGREGKGREGKGREGREDPSSPRFIHEQTLGITSNNTYRNYLPNIIKSSSQSFI